MKNKASSLLTLAIVIYCAWNASNLFSLSGIRFESYGLIPLIVWCIPLFYYLLTESFRLGGNPYILGAALVISFLSAIVDLNVLAHIGFALALMSLVPLSFRLVPWYLSAIAWFPAFSYFGARYFPDYVVPLRYLIAFFGAIWGILILYRRKQ